MALFLDRLDASNLAGSSFKRAMSTDRRKMFSGVGQPRCAAPLVWAMPPWLLVDCLVVRDLAALLVASIASAGKLEVAV